MAIAKGTSCKDYIIRKEEACKEYISLTRLIMAEIATADKKISSKKSLVFTSLKQSFIFSKKIKDLSEEAH